MANDRVQLFEDQPIRTAWVEDEVFPRRADKTPEVLKLSKHTVFEFCRYKSFIRQNQVRI